MARSIFDKMNAQLGLENFDGDTTEVSPELQQAVDETQVDYSIPADVESASEISASDAADVMDDITADDGSEVTDEAIETAEGTEEVITNATTSVEALEALHSRMLTLAAGRNVVSQEAHAVLWVAAKPHIDRLGVKTTVPSVENFGTTTAARQASHVASLETLGESIRAGWDRLVAFVKNVISAIGDQWNKLFDGATRLVKQATDAKAVVEKLEDSKPSKTAAKAGKFAMVLNNGGATNGGSAKVVMKTWATVLSKIPRATTELVAAGTDGAEKVAEENAAPKVEKTITDAIDSAKSAFSQIGSVTQTKGQGEGFHYHTLTNFGYGKDARFQIITADGMDQSSYFKVEFIPGSYANPGNVAALSKADMLELLNQAIQIGTSAVNTRKNTMKELEGIRNEINKIANNAIKAADGDAAAGLKHSRTLCLNTVTAVTSFTKIAYARGIEAGQMGLQYVNASLKTYG